MGRTTEAERNPIIARRERSGTIGEYQSRVHRAIRPRVGDRRPEKRSWRAAARIVVHACNEGTAACGGRGRLDRESCKGELRRRVRLGRVNDTRGHVDDRADPGVLPNPPADTRAIVARGIRRRGVVRVWRDKVWARFPARSAVVEVGCRVRACPAAIRVAAIGTDARPGLALQTGPGGSARGPVGLRRVGTGARCGVARPCGVARVHRRTTHGVGADAAPLLARVTLQTLVRARVPRADLAATAAVGRVVLGVGAGHPAKVRR